MEGWFCIVSLCSCFWVHALNVKYCKCQIYSRHVYGHLEDHGDQDLHLFYQSFLWISISPEIWFLKANIRGDDIMQIDFLSVCACALCKSVQVFDKTDDILRCEFLFPRQKFFCVIFISCCCRHVWPILEIFHWTYRQIIVSTSCKFVC